MSLKRILLNRKVAEKYEEKIPLSENIHLIDSIAYSYRRFDQRDILESVELCTKYVLY